MKILVLGSEGQIGKPTCEFLKRSGHEVIHFDVKRGFSEDLRYEATTHFHIALRKCDFVYYFASDVGGAKYLEEKQDSLLFMIDNMKIMMNVFDGLKRYNKPFIFTSSQMAELPHSPYGNLKLLGEKMARAAGGMFVRLWNVYGLEEDNQKSHVITDFCNMARNGEIKMRTDGEECRQFLYAEDCAEALLALTEKYDSLDNDKNYHITSFEWVSIVDIAEKIHKISNCGIRVGEKKDNTQKNAKNDPDPYILNFWKPKTSLEDGLKKIYFGV